MFLKRKKKHKTSSRHMIIKFLKTHYLSGTRVRNKLNSLSLTMWARRQRNKSFKVLKGAGVGGDPYQAKILNPAKISFKQEGKTQDFFRETKIQRIHFQMICIMQFVKGSSLSMKMIPDRNLDLHRGMMDTSNGK